VTLTFPEGWLSVKYERSVILSPLTDAKSISEYVTPGGHVDPVTGHVFVSAYTEDC
jgi:hypothetical protein